MIPQFQQERLQNLSQELQFAMNSHNISSMEYHSEETRRELRNLPDEVHLFQACIFAIQQAKAVAPTQANAMSHKFSRMLNADAGGYSNEADRLWWELQPDVQHWLNQGLNQELPSNSIITGLRR